MKKVLSPSSEKNINKNAWKKKPLKYFFIKEINIMYARVPVL